MFMTPGESFATWVLFLELESYLKNIIQTTDPYTIIFKNRLQKTLDIIIGEHQSTAITKIEQFYILLLLFVT